MTDQDGDGCSAPADLDDIHTAQATARANPTAGLVELGARALATVVEDIPEWDDMQPESRDRLMSLARTVLVGCCQADPISLRAGGDTLRALIRSSDDSTLTDPFFGEAAASLIFAAVIQSATMGAPTSATVH